MIFLVFRLFFFLYIHRVLYFVTMCSFRCYTTLLLKVISSHLSLNWKLSCLEFSGLQSISGAKCMVWPLLSVNSPVWVLFGLIFQVMELPHLASHLEIICEIFGSCGFFFFFLLVCSWASSPGPSIFSSIASLLVQERWERLEQKF